MLLSTAYLPPIEYFQKLVSADASIELHEHFVKQTYRNRCSILGPNGVQMLSIPLVNDHEKTVVAEKRIAYAENWQQQHWRSIRTAYANSPYFIYYSDELRIFYENRFEFLFEYNNEILKVLLKMLKIKTAISFTESFTAPSLNNTENDFRNSISPKVVPKENFKPYSQVFSAKYPFAANLSIIDLLFNKGPESKEFII